MPKRTATKYAVSQRKAGLKRMQARRRASGNSAYTNGGTASAKRGGQLPTGLRPSGLSKIIGDIFGIK